MTELPASDYMAIGKLFAKIARVTAAMQRVPKNGWNDFQKYKYATESDIVDALRVAMGDEKLAILPRVDKTEIVSSNDKGQYVRLHMTFIVGCGDTGASIALPWIGDGQDKGDKAVYKAYTGAEKYFLMKLFLIATGDDPEQDEAPPARQQAQRPTPPPAPPPLSPEVADLMRRFKGARDGLVAHGVTVPQLKSSDVAGWSLEKLSNEVAIAEAELQKAITERGGMVEA